MERASQTPKSEGLPSVQITGLLGLRGDDNGTVSETIGEPEPRISETISRGRRNERIRIKLCLHLNLAYEALWGGEPKWRQVPAEVHSNYEARFQTSESVAV